jgi:F0F1-type ATP synthase beta subunit
LPNLGTTQEKLIVCLPAPRFRHEITAALPRLAADGSILTTIVLHPQTTDPAPAADVVPEGYTSHVVLDPTRARRRLYPAISPQLTQTTAWPSPEHAHTAQRAQELLAAYETLDPELARPDPADLADPELARHGQRLLRYLRQPFHVYQAFSSIPGQATPLVDPLKEVGEIVTELLDSDHADAPPLSSGDGRPPLP